LYYKNRFRKDINIKTVHFSSVLQELYIQIMATLCFPIVTMLGAQCTLQDSSICIYLYLASYNTPTLRPIWFFSAFFSRSHNVFDCFHRDVLEFLAWHISILKKKTAEDFEISVETHDSTHCHNSEEWSVDIHHFKNLNSYTVTLYVRLTLMGQVPISNE
jgi:hypothetical protein